MKELHVGIIAEGVTDHSFLNELVCRLLDKNEDCEPLQPSEFSDAGWPGVMAYCLQNISKIGYENYMNSVGEPFDLLIVALDGDITREGTVYCFPGRTACPPDKQRYPLDCYYERSKGGPGNYQQCSYPASNFLPHLPISDRVEFIRGKVYDWCGLPIHTLEPKLMIVIPCDMIETWLISALDGAIIEGRSVEEYKSPFRRYICQTQDYHGWTPFETGKKQFFMKFQDYTLNNWDKVTSICTQAKKFNDDLINFKNALCQSA